jgi:catechol 2,3-dioxygenase-like lactoylglutathione lyase family enzyme
VGDQRRADRLREAGDLSAARQNVAGPANPVTATSPAATFAQTVHHGRWACASGIVVKDEPRPPASPMTDRTDRPADLQLDHLIVPSADRVVGARLLAELLGVPWADQGRVGPFSPVYVNDGLTLDFDQCTGPVPQLHFAFRVDTTQFDAILGRIRAAGRVVRSLPHGPDDHQVNAAFGGRIVYWRQPDGHVWELLTVSYERQAPPTDA